MLQNLNNLTPEIKALQEEVRQFGDTSSPEIKALLETSKTIEAKWEALKKAANQRDEQLEASTKHTQNFQAQLDKMLLWLQLNK
ncbi:hypothetical protein DPMN_194861 [Dreissena polymorpha]|uniref:Uncharacterized protein n=1 Tax=Dreissena polymorpha TaxID=45954 RepID=A0A9D3Y5T2_DREPO|nr:hypothetical protein DPMN_194861 [Dreissena polymorpha]